jgi:hypothetical protein
MRRRISIRELLVVITVLALGLGALKSGSDFWLQATAALTLFMLGVGLLGVLLRAKPHGAWMGLSLFGWTCYLMTVLPVLEPLGRYALKMDLIESLAIQLHPFPAAPTGLVAPAGLLSPKGMGRSPGDVQAYVRNYPLEVANEMQRASAMRGNPLPPQIAAYIKDSYLVQTLRANTLEIGKLLRCLIVGFVGSLVGRFLAARREPPASSPG